MKRLTPALVLCTCLVFVSGCTGHLVHLKGELLEPSARTINPGSSVYVLEKNQFFLPEKGVHLKDRILSYLKSRKITDGDHKTADYYLVLGYRLLEGREVREKTEIMAPYSGYADISGNPSSPLPTVQPLNPAPMVMNNVRTLYETRVSAKLIDGRAYRETGTMKTLWSGTASTAMNYPWQYEDVVPLMVPVVLDMLNENVEKEIIVWEKISKKRAGF